MWVEIFFSSGKKFGQKIWPHQLVCRWPPTDSGLFGTLESKKNRKLGKLAY